MTINDVLPVAVQVPFNKYEEEASTLHDEQCEMLECPTCDALMEEDKSITT